VLCSQGCQEEEGQVRGPAAIPDPQETELVALYGVDSGGDEGVPGPVQSESDRWQAMLYVEDG
jgi:hypothetical protein